MVFLVGCRTKATKNAMRKLTQMYAKTHTYTSKCKTKREKEKERMIEWKKERRNTAHFFFSICTFEAIMKHELLRFEEQPTNRMRK